MTNVTNPKHRLTVIMKCNGWRCGACYFSQSVVNTWIVFDQWIYQWISESTLVSVHDSCDVFVCDDVKGLVHPKMKILSVFTHPHVVPSLYVYLFCWTQRKIFGRIF